ncbi:MAG TPA: c-type cytochrome [Longimicrobiales bacterium]|nr:c-type cytochrome [Longimicrobiales bacterium]
MFDASPKKWLLGVLVACFAVQTFLVYADEATGQLSEAAVRGRRLFHRGSCQVCHQLYGQGGFLGPDLTNAASRVDDTRLASLLTAGSGQMPAFGYSEAQIADLKAFLVELDRPDLGRGQLRMGDPAAGAGPMAAFEVAVRAADVPADAAAGLEALSGRICSTCHVPFRTSVVGAPDLSTVVERLDASELRAVLVGGRPEKGMPPPAPALTREELDGVVAWLRWLNANRADLVAATDQAAGRPAVAWSRLPWWEYR